MTRKRIFGKKRTKELTRSQIWALRSRWSQFGPGCEFETEADYHSAWDDCRESLLADSRAGMRPGAYWKYDAPEIDAQRIPFEDDDQLLYRMGMLSPEEIAELSERKGVYPPKPADGRDPRESLEDGPQMDLGQIKTGKHESQD